MLMKNCAPPLLGMPVFAIAGGSATSDTTAFVVGGFALEERIRQQLKYTAHCDTMQQLDDFATQLLLSSS